MQTSARGTGAPRKCQTPCARSSTASGRAARWGGLRGAAEKCVCVGGRAGAVPTAPQTPQRSCPCPCTCQVERIQDIVMDDFVWQVCVGAAQLTPLACCSRDVECGSGGRPPAAHTHTHADQ
jgi:hypothetical protein